MDDHRGTDHSRVVVAWRGVVVTRRVSIRIVWTHPEALVRVFAQGGDTTKTWPVVLGMGPILGVVPVVSKLGITDPILCMHTVLDSALRT